MEAPVRPYTAILADFSPRATVATGDRVYVALDYGDPVTVLDAATGEPRTTLADTGGARELLLAEGTLFVLADDMTTAQGLPGHRDLERPGRIPCL